MEIPFFNLDGVLFLLRWMHIYFGIIWIGLLYYFNFVQGSFMKEASAGAKPDVLTKLLPRALWWFRWAALWTMVTGIILILAYAHQVKGFNNSWGLMIGIGASMGLVMGLNVWGIIWRNQKIVIKSAEQVAAGGQALPEAAAAGAKALLASRTNTLLSVPMLYFMAASRHLAIPTSENSNFTLYWIVAFLILAGIEVNAIKGKLGPIESIKGVITGGFVLVAVYSVLMIVLI